MLRDKKNIKMLVEHYLPIVNTYDTHYLLNHTFIYRQVSETEMYGR